jgi:type I restriction enzyme M protein
LETKSLGELRQIAKENGVQVKPDATKQQFVDAILGESEEDGEDEVDALGDQSPTGKVTTVPTGVATPAAAVSTADSHSERVNFIWSVKEILRDHYKRHQYGEVILPLCTVRRLDCELDDTKEKVVAKAASIKGDLDTHADVLAHVAGHPFYNTSRFTFETLLDDPEHITENVYDYLQGFSPNARFALEKFGIESHIDRMGEAGILFMVIQRFASIDLRPAIVSNLEMGYIYEELIRVNAELSNEEAGEHFTPREVIHLMVNLLFSDEDQLLTPGKIATIYDPACGTGGMLTVAEDYLREKNPKARLHLYGQEIQPESFAICQSDMMIKNEQSARIVCGDSFTQDGFEGTTFDYMLANPPYGKDWKTVEKAIKTENASMGFAGRFGAGLPPTTDGQILFLQQMISKMRPVKDGGSRIGIVMNGSPLFSGDAGSGFSGIRRWIIENDWLEAIVGLPDQLFYNTGIYTYVWVVTNRKRPERQGYVQLIDARNLYRKMKKSLGFKRNELSPDDIGEITHVFESFTDGGLSKIFPNRHFGYSKVTLERPLRVRFDISEETLAVLVESKSFKNLAAEVRVVLTDGLRHLLGRSFRTEINLEEALTPVYKKSGKIPAPVKGAILAALMVRDPGAEPQRGETDTLLRDTENVSFGEDIDAFVATEVTPFVPDAWVDKSKTKLGYEISFSREFYTYLPPRALQDIDADIKSSEARILSLLAEVTQ